jgi:hypothetical protein
MSELECLGETRAFEQSQAHPQLWSTRA